MRSIIFVKMLALAVISITLPACATYGDYAASMREGLIKGQPELSLRVAEKRDPSQEKVIASLDKGMLRRMTGDYAGSTQIFEIAKQKIEALYGVSVTENLASLTLNETFRGYMGDRYEQLLLHAYIAMNYIQQGQLDGARVEMLQANVKMMQWGDEPQEDPFIHYIGGIIYESLGEYDDALISYRKAYNTYKQKSGVPMPLPSQALKSDLLRMLASQGLWDEYDLYKKEFSMATFKVEKRNDSFGELIVLLNNGLAPVRREAAIHIYSSEVEQNLRVAFPVYKANKKTLLTPEIKVAGKQYTMESVEDIDALARYSLLQDKPGIMVRATARAVIKYNSQVKAQDKGSLAGILVTVTNIATERADTRSWTTLPQEIQIKRIALPAGEHEVEIQMVNAAGQVVDVMKEKINIIPKKTQFIIHHWNAVVPVKK